jgi:hypothetical protein
VTSSLPCDYDDDPERWRTSRLSVERYSVAGDVQQPVAEYLRGRGIDAEIAAEIAQAVVVPLDVTKRGVLVWARR